CAGRGPEFFRRFGSWSLRRLRLERRAQRAFMRRSFSGSRVVGQAPFVRSLHRNHQMLIGRTSPHNPGCARIGVAGVDAWVKLYAKKHEMRRFLQPFLAFRRFRCEWIGVAWTAAALEHVAHPGTAKFWLGV